MPRPQQAISAFEQCRKPVIVVVDGACIGGGVDLISACDIRYCTDAAYFCIKEVEVGLVRGRLLGRAGGSLGEPLRQHSQAADIGTLQRLPRIVGNEGLVRELAYTARKMEAREALAVGLVSKVEPSREAAMESARATARLIARHSPLAVLGTKMSLNYSRDHTIQEGLDHVRLMNSVFLQSPDVPLAAMSSMRKQVAAFSKL